MDEDKVVLCASSKYEEKYYLNPAFDKLPDAIKESYENNGSVRNRYGYLIYMRSAYPTKNQIMKITPDDEGIPYSGNSAASCISKIQSYEGRRGEIGNSEDGSVKEFRRIFDGRGCL